MTPFGQKDLGQYWFRQWLVVWWHQAITCTNVDLSQKGALWYVFKSQQFSQGLRMNVAGVWRLPSAKLQPHHPTKTNELNINTWHSLAYTICCVNLYLSTLDYIYLKLEYIQLPIPLLQRKFIKTALKLEHGWQITSQRNHGNNNITHV